MLWSPNLLKIVRAAQFMATLRKSNSFRGKSASRHVQKAVSHFSIWSKMGHLLQAIISKGSFHFWKKKKAYNTRSNTNKNWESQREKKKKGERSQKERKNGSDFWYIYFSSAKTHTKITASIFGFTFLWSFIKEML